MPSSEPKTRYPIRKIWLFKNVLYVIPASIILLLDPIILVLVLIGVPFGIIVNAIRLACFSYALDEKYLRIKQGILNRQERHIPYEVIQDILVQRDIGDRIMGLSSLSVHNASQGGTMVDQYGNSTRTVFGLTMSGGRNKSYYEVIGFRGNMVHFPGLSPADAEALKQALLKKMKEHQALDTGAGL